MDNETFRLIGRHQSVRNYKEQPVSRALVEQIVAAGQRASTSSNLQMYRAIAVTDQSRKQQLALLCGGQKHIAQAPVFIAWCADYSRLALASESAGLEVEAGYVENFILAAVDTALLMQTAALAAESLGLGICFIGGIRNESQAVIDLLKLPRYCVPISGMTLGWPDVAENVRPRLPLETILHWEQYDPAGEADALAAYDEAMIATGIYSGRQVAVAGKEGEMKAYGWTEHSARRSSQPKRVELRAVLEKQGFTLK